MKFIEKEKMRGIFKASLAVKILLFFEGLPLVKQIKRGVQHFWVLSSYWIETICGESMIPTINIDYFRQWRFSFYTTSCFDFLCSAVYDGLDCIHQSASWRMAISFSKFISELSWIRQSVLRSLQQDFSVSIVTVYNLSYKFFRG